VDAAMTFAAHIRGYEAFKTLYRQTHGKELEAHLLSQWTFSQDDLVAFRRIAGAS
jgi:hypothetical protein